jgi:hypothetical protein
VAKFKALVGIDYPPNKRVEAGDVVDDLPADSVKWLKDQGMIEAVEDAKKKAAAPVVEEAE